MIPTPSEKKEFHGGHQGVTKTTMEEKNDTRQVIGRLRNVETEAHKGWLRQHSYGG